MSTSTTGDYCPILDSLGVKGNGRRAGARRAGRKATARAALSGERKTAGRPSMTEVVTGEAVVLDVPCARFPSRMIAIIIDMTVQVILIGIILGVLLGTAHLNAAWLGGGGGVVVGVVV